jgi:predicted lipoprotein with Yx(FWY)xxD motif
MWSSSISGADKPPACSERITAKRVEEEVMRRIMIAFLMCALLTACGNEPAETSGSGSGSGSQEGGQGGAQEAATLQVASSNFGDILVDSEGMTLYMFVPDQQKGGKPTCFGECAQAWPALTASGEPTVGAGLEEAEVGTVERKDGKTQVTYNDLPLYRFSGDKAAGDTNGQSLNDVWWVVSTSGKPVRVKASDGDQY